MSLDVPVTRLSWRTTAVAALALFLLATHCVVLFVVIPDMSARMTHYYNQNKSPDGYDVLAENLVDGVGYRFSPDTASTLMREPGYPLFLAGLFWLFGTSFSVIKLANLGLTFATAGMLTLLARRLTTSSVGIAAAALLFLAHPGILVAESRGSVEVLFAFFLTLFLFSFYRALDSDTAMSYVVSGVALGVTVLVKSTVLLFPFVLFAYLLWYQGRGGRLQACRRMAQVVAAMAVVVSPWVFRNYALTKTFVPASSVLGVSAHAGQFIGEHLSTASRWVDLDHAAARERSFLARGWGYQFKDGYYQLFYTSVDEVQFSHELLRYVIARYAASPMLFVRCAGLNLFTFWFAGKTWGTTLLNVAVQLPYLLLAFAGAVSIVRQGRLKIALPVMLLIVYSFVVTVPILAQARYSIPLLPFVSLLGAMALVALRRPAMVLTPVAKEVGA